MPSRALKTIRRLVRSPRTWIGLAMLGTLIASAAYARNTLGLEWSIESLREVVAELGVWGPIGFVALVAFRGPLLMSSQMVLIVGGLAFGTLGGTLYGAAGLVGSATIIFVMTRFLGAETIRSQVPPGLRHRLAQGGTRGGAAALAVATAYPVGPMSLFHGAAALTPMPILVFWIATFFAGLVRAGAYSWFGSSLVDGDWLQAAIAGGLMLAVLAPFAHPRFRAFVRRQFELPEGVEIAEAGAPPPGPTRS